MIKKIRPPDDSGRRRPHRPASRLSWWRRVFWRVLAVGLMCCTLAGGTILAVYSHMARSYDLRGLGQMPERTAVLDRKGQVIGRMNGEDRIVVPLSEVSPWFIKALLAREDTRFYTHGGIDFIGVARAMARNLKDGRIVQGASTLTMQLARNSFPDLDDRSFHRKLLEMMLARRIEKYATKNQIIEHYINRIFFGTGIYGIQRASQVYFGKHASQLTLSEAALIAGIIRSPVRFSPFRNYDGAIKERDDVLRRMLAMKMITPQQELAARYDDIILHAQPVFQSQGGYALDAVKKELDLLLEAKEIEDGGLQVFTTLDKDLQTAAEAAVEARLRAVEALPGYAHPSKATFDAAWDLTTEFAATPYLQSAVCLKDNDTGGYLALVGGRDYRQSRFNRALLGSRQIGSTVKPLVYAAAIAAGLQPGSLIQDAPLKPHEIDGADENWNPRNSDGKFLGPTPLITGLVESRNSMTIRIGNYAGLDRVLQLLKEAGFSSKTPRTPQIYIGNVSSSPAQVTNAFSLFPNQGVSRPGHFIERILDKNGNEIYRAEPQDMPILSPGVAHILRRLLAQVIESGTAAAVRNEYGFHEPGGGKTGTTNDYKDAWFAGYTDRLTCGVWVGLDKPLTIVEEGYGGKLAVPIWADVMKKAVALGYVPEAPKVEIPLTRVLLCRTSNDLATDACHLAGMAYEDDIPFELVPQSFCREHTGIGPGAIPPGSPAIPTPPRRSAWERFKGLFR
ncbi:MAG: transglycosylase domain-containing protein [Verrucomicrobiaceae bacterium]|nr:transglycosylase domain-containing protein [Verrucomicrobiaceae bacterium]